jgi:hypothetical protein
MKKAGPYILIAVLAIVLYYLKNNNNPPKHNGKEAERTENNRLEPNARERNRLKPVPNTDETRRKDGLGRNVQLLEYTQHAKCRMQCRHITNEEVEDMLQNGVVNYRKSTLQGRPCPAYAVEGYTKKDNQHVRIVFAKCDTKIKVVTCIDLDNDFSCHCPGDEKK